MSTPIVAPTPLTREQREQARARISRHYDLQRLATDAEIDDEIATLRRLNGNYHSDGLAMLAASLQNGPHPVKL